MLVCVETKKVSLKRRVSWARKQIDGRGTIDGRLTALLCCCCDMAVATLCVLFSLSKVQSAIRLTSMTCCGLSPQKCWLFFFGLRDFERCWGAIYPCGPTTSISVPHFCSVSLRSFSLFWVTADEPRDRSERKLKPQLVVCVCASCSSSFILADGREGGARAEFVA